MGLLHRVGWAVLGERAMRKRDREKFLKDIEEARKLLLTDKLRASKKEEMRLIKANLYRHWRKSR